MDLNRAHRLWTVQFKDLHIMDFAVVDVEAQRRADNVDSLDSGCPGVQNHHVEVLVIDHLEDV